MRRLHFTAFFSLGVSLQESGKMCNFAGYMRKHIFVIVLALVAVVACKQNTGTPRPTIGLVQSILTDTTGIRGIAGLAGSKGAGGSIAILGEPQEVVTLARRFQSVDLQDNVDGSAQRDSLPDFAGEVFDAILDAYNAPYSHFLADSVSLDSLREVAVRGALHAWDTTCLRLASDHKALLKKSSAKILIYTSSLQAQYGLFDVDTLQQLTGGKCRLLSPVDILLDQALEAGVQNIAVWAPKAVKDSRIWETAFGLKDRVDATLAVFTPEQALDVRTQLRGILRQYRNTGLPLDALIIDDYQVDLGPLQSELRLIRRGGTEEDAAFDKMLSARFNFYDPADALIRTTYGILREENLFAHRIARPVVKYYETAESEMGEQVLVEAAPSYVQSAYVSELH